MKCDGIMCKLKELYSTEEQQKKWVEECEATAKQCPLFTEKLEQKSEHRPMAMDDKYFGLLGTYIYDKRTKMNGILSDLCVMGLPNGYMVYYNAYMNSIRNNAMIFVEDFESGNVVFLEPFGIVYMEKEMKEIAKRHRKAITDFFGDNFREDMIVRISENERQKKIKEWEKYTYSLIEFGSINIEQQIKK